MTLGFNPAQALRATSLPFALESDFFDPTQDGSDVAWYGSSVASLAPGATQFSTLQIDAGVDFYWMMTTLQADIAGQSTGASPYTEANFLVPLIKIDVKPVDSQANFNNLQIPVTTLTGPGERPDRLVRARRIEGNTVLQFRWTSYDAAATYTHIFVVLHGYVYPAANLT